MISAPALHLFALCLIEDCTQRVGSNQAASPTCCGAPSRPQQQQTAAASARMQQQQEHGPTGLGGNSCNDHLRMDLPASRAAADIKLPRLLMAVPLTTVHLYLNYSAS